MKHKAWAGTLCAAALVLTGTVVLYPGASSAQDENASPVCNNPDGCAPPPPVIEDTRTPCEKLGGCQEFGSKRSKRKGGLSGFGVRTEKTNISFSSRRKRHTSVFKAGVKKGRGKNRGYKGSRKRR